MKIQPVEFMPEPGYPDKYASEAKRALVAARPRRWLGAPLAVGVLTAAMALGSAGCGAPYVTAGIPIPIPTPITTPIAPPTATESFTLGVPPVSIPQAMFIPLFEAGEGTGVIGCVAVASPVFLSEEEAFAVISAAFREAGLTLTENAETLDNVVLPMTDMFAFSDKSSSVPGTTQGEFTPDGMLDAGGGLSVEFVSVGDFEAWQKETEMWVSVSGYDVKEAARTLARYNPDMIAFYDPMTEVDYSTLCVLEQEEDESDEEYYARMNAAYGEVRQEALSESKQLLRKQVQALIEWLFAEGFC